MTDGFLSRWSRLKRRELDDSSSPASELDSSVAIEDASIESDTSVVITDVEESESSPHSSEELPSEEVVLTDIDMPDLSTITSKSDMSMFFSSGVSAELKKKALRQFFHQPEFNVRDPLDDYALDYSNPTKLILKPGEVVRGWAQERMDEPWKRRGMFYFRIIKWLILKMFLLKKREWMIRKSMPLMSQSCTVKMNKARQNDAVVDSRSIKPGFRVSILCFYGRKSWLLNCYLNTITK
ncbi:DUF3306 domain-containing protein [Nitrincola nitratireducens]|uniref:DUF3306 domain-containing protein n=1 Tax=Nitrincola nitratireducens TaxID=1229521 RepID=W9UYT4_9GAMM|nr:DUF3306 domain-containing protein [Nitrincola nitratireducens]EXJ09851.1 hypothetical protein D791_03179 [Nitrincola nitratireducens]